MSGSDSVLGPELPLVGRKGDLQELYRIFGDDATTEPFVLLEGEGGVGKSRLARTVANEAARRGWQVCYGRAYPVETGAPYALVSDAFLPLLRQMDEPSLTVLTRGNLADLRRLFPVLGPTDDARWETGENPQELRTRLFWSFTELVQRMGARSPLLVVLEDLHWADASSLALVHFLGRHLGGLPVRVLTTYNTEYRGDRERLIRLVRSLLSLRKLRQLPLHPLSREDTYDLIEQVFGVSAPSVHEFADVLFGWTRGNPYFLEQTLEALVSSGTLYHRDGTWLGWEARELELPTSVRDAVLVRLTRLSPGAVEMAEILAVVGAPASPALLGAVSGLDGARVARSVEHLVRSSLVRETRTPNGVTLEFDHPLTRETLYQRLSITRRHVLHRAIAEGLEAISGDRAMERADELAYHWVQAADDSVAPRAAKYLTWAGRAALRRHADREAADYLSAAVGMLAPDREAPGNGRGRGANGPSSVDVELPELWRELARARARLGQYAEAEALWTRILAAAEADGDLVSIAQSQRHLGLLAFWSGRHGVALERYDRALAALGTGSSELRARIHVAAGLALQELGQPQRGRDEVRKALAIAEASGDDALLGRVHRALALLFTFTGEAARAREHGWKAVELADRSGDDQVAFWGRWALASLEGLAGGPDAIEGLMAECRDLAVRMRSPVLGLWVTELEVEHAYFSGDWDRALAQGERGIVLADNLNQRALMARLMVWTATCYLGRGDLDRGRELVNRAWGLADLDREGADRRRDVHAVVPAIIGRVALLMAEEQYAEAIEVGERGLEIAGRIGYVLWVLHRLLPLVAEAYFRVDALDRVTEAVTRLRTEGARMDHRLALAYADAGAALVAWQAGERLEEAIALLRGAAAGLEQARIIPEAARLRRQLAGRLAELGDREGALAELRAVHDVFERLGARPELEKARQQFRELGSRPPTRSGEGAGALTERERVVARLVAERRSNKAVARALGISPRTVTTHLTNIYRKLEIGSRGELVDMVREGRIPPGDAAEARP